MIHVDQKPEPLAFLAQVGKPGARFLTSNRNPTSEEWKSHSYWRKLIPELHDAYDGICAYSSEFIPLVTGNDTVEHFLPKSRHPNQAYRWTNYRLVCLRMNGRKGARQILDPFKIKNAWFTLQFPSLQILIGSTMPSCLHSIATATISILDLNGEGSIKSRERWVRNYCRGHISSTYLQQNAPFIYMELQRQCLMGNIVGVMRYP